MSAGSRTTDTAGAWHPGADIAALRARAAVLAAVRAHFAAAGVLEVETPLLGRAAGTDPGIAPMRTRYTGPGHAGGLNLYLQTSPEFAMKRLLAAGSGPIFQVCKAFRDGEAGRWHNPEFTILEWYRPGWETAALMDEVAAIARLALAQPGLPVEHHRYGDLFARQLGIDVFAVATDRLRDELQRRGLFDGDRSDLDRDACLDLLMGAAVQPQLGRDALCFVTDYPASQAALARRNPDGRTAARFELFFRGVELANGFDELVDADEQAARFGADNHARQRRGLPVVPVDDALLDAMRSGLPDCAGVAMGLDRLLMLRLGVDDIDAVTSFALHRA
jgi:lysyl-tRNA synthetase class 2